MHICIDSCVFIQGLRSKHKESQTLLNLIGPELILVIPRLVAQEVTRNLNTPEQVKNFYHLFQIHHFAQIVDEPVPRPLVEKYINLGLPQKADAFIGAFAEWMKIEYLISANRHFLRDLKTDTFDILDAPQFITLWNNRHST